MDNRQKRNQKSVQNKNQRGTQNRKQSRKPSRTQNRKQNEVKLIMILVLAVLVVVSIIGGVMKERGKPKTETADGTKGETSADGTPESLQGAASSVDIGDEEVKAQITSLIRQYRAACASADVGTIAALYNVTELQNETTFMAMATIITGYQNTECYIRQGLDAASWVVFIYDDLKLADFDTLVPNLSYVYVKAGTGGTFYIDPGTYNEETMSYEYDKKVLDLIDNLEGDSEIAELVKNVNQKFAQACETNSDLKAYIDKLSASAAKEEKNNKDSADETKPQADTETGTTDTGVPSDSAESKQQDTAQDGQAGTTAESGSMSSSESESQSGSAAN